MPICAICGENVEKVTIDHIPPQNLFGDKKPNNQIKVLSCDGCNQGSSKDDEYFRLIAMAANTSIHPTAAEAALAFGRSMERPQAAKFKDTLSKSIFGLPVVVDGKEEILPHMALDFYRLDNIALKVTKGLFYHSKGYPVPKNYKVLGANLDLFMEYAFDKGNPEKGIAEVIATYLMPKISEVKPVIIGNDVFAYQEYYDNDDVNTSFVLMTFYGQSWRWFGLVMPK